MMMNRPPAQEEQHRRRKRKDDGRGDSTSPTFFASYEMSLKKKQSVSSSYRAAAAASSSSSDDDELATRRGPVTIDSHCWKLSSHLSNIACHHHEARRYDQAQRYYEDAIRIRVDACRYMLNEQDGGGAGATGKASGGGGGSAATDGAGSAGAASGSVGVAAAGASRGTATTTQQPQQTNAAALDLEREASLLESRCRNAAQVEERLWDKTIHIDGEEFQVQRLSSPLWTNRRGSLVGGASAEEEEKEKVDTTSTMLSNLFSPSSSSSTRGGGDDHDDDVFSFLDDCNRNGGDEAESGDDPSSVFLRAGSPLRTDSDAVVQVATAPTPSSFSSRGGHVAGFGNDMKQKERMAEIKRERKRQSAVTLHNLGLLFQQRRDASRHDDDAALRMYNAALTVLPNPSSDPVSSVLLFHRTATVHYRCGQIEEAVMDLNEAMRWARFYISRSSSSSSHHDRDRQDDQEEGVYRHRHVRMHHHHEDLNMMSDPAREDDYDYGDRNDQVRRQRKRRYQQEIKNNFRTAVERTLVLLAKIWCDQREYASAANCLRDFLEWDDDQRRRRHHAPPEEQRHGVVAAALLGLARLSHRLGADVGALMHCEGYLDMARRSRSALRWHHSPTSHRRARDEAPPRPSPATSRRQFHPLRVAAVIRSVGLLKYRSGRRQGLVDEAIVSLTEAIDLLSDERAAGAAAAAPADANHHGAVDDNDDRQRRRMRARTLLDLGKILHDQGRLADAANRYNESLRTFRRLLRSSSPPSTSAVGRRDGHDEYAVGTILCKLGQLYGERGEYQRSLHVYEEALSVCRRLCSRGGGAEGSDDDDDQELVATMLSTVGDAYLEIGETGIAMMYYADAARAWRRRRRQRRDVDVDVLRSPNGRGDARRGGGWDESSTTTTEAAVPLSTLHPNPWLDRSMHRSAAMA